MSSQGSGVSNEIGGGSYEEAFQQLISTDWRERKAAVQALIQAGPVDLVQRVLRLIREDHTRLNVLSPTLQVLEQAGRPVVPELIALLNGADKELRIYIPIILSKLGGPEVVETLIQTAEDTSQPDNVRFNAIEGLGKLRAGEATRMLRDILHSKRDFLQYSAIAALGQIGPLAVAATEDVKGLLDDPFLSEPAITTFAQICPAHLPEGAAVIAGWMAQPQGSATHAITALAELARRSPNPDAVERGFLNWLDEAGANKLQQLLENLERPTLPAADLALVCGWLARPPATSTPWWKQQLQQQAGRALVSLLETDSGRRAAEAALLGQQSLVLDELIAAAGSANVGQAGAALRLLGAAARNEAARNEAAAQEANKLFERVFPLLLDALESEDETLAARAAEALGETGRVEAAEALWARINHPASQVRLAAVHALYTLGVEDTTKRAVDWLKDPDPQRRATALSLLAVSQAHELHQAVLVALEDPAPEVRRAAIEVLPQLSTQLPDANIPDRIKAFLSSDDSAIRHSAVQAAARLAPEAARPLLVQACKDANGWIRLHAIKHLAPHPHPDTLPTLLRLADDPLPPVRAAVILGLSKALELPLDIEQQTALRRKLLETRMAMEGQVTGSPPTASNFSGAPFGSGS